MLVRPVMIWLQPPFMQTEGPPLAGAVNALFSMTEVTLHSFRESLDQLLVLCS
jgi:hypothetical protein